MRRALVLLLLSCRREAPVAHAVDAEMKPSPSTAAPSPRCPDAVTIASLGEVGTPPGAWLSRLETAELYVRIPKDLVRAPEADNVVLRGYPKSPLRGRRNADRQITLLAERRVYAVNEPVRVIHVLEVFAKGEDLFVMGPKPITGEWVDGTRVTPEVPTWGAFTMGIYDGAVMQSPGLDVNFEISVYPFATPGLHHVQWRAGVVDSNVLCVEVR